MSKLQLIFLKNFISLATLILLPVILFAQWSSDPNINTPICTETTNQREVDIASDGMGGVYLVWRDYRNETNVFYGDLYVQRLDSNGVNQWDENGLVLMRWANGQFTPIAVSDGNVGALMIWEQNLGGLYNTELWAQHIDTSGAPMWTGMGLPVAQVLYATEYFPQAIPDGLGGVIVTWQRLPQVPGTTDIFAQRLLGSGAPQWTLNGENVCSATDNQNDPILCSDGSGGAFIAWTDWRPGFPNADIYAQHISATGISSFVQDGIPVCNESARQEYAHLLAGDGPGVAFVLWHDFRHGNSDIFAQKMSSSGNFFWANNGIPVCIEPHDQNNAAIISDGAGGFIVSWTDLRDDAGNIYAQRIDGSGVDQWAANGIPVCSVAGIQDLPVMVSDESGGAIIIWQDFRNDATGDLYAQRIDSNGQALWSTNGVAICSAPNDQIYPVAISDGHGGAIIAWEDARMGNLDYNIYAQWVDQQGNLGGVAGIPGSGSELVENFMLHQNYPNPFNPTTTIEFDLPHAGFVTLKIYNILGEEVVTLVSEELGVGKYECEWDASGLSCGVYFYRLTAGKYDAIKKMLLVK